MPGPDLEELIQIILGAVARETGRPRDYLSFEVEHVIRTGVDLARSAGESQRPPASRDLESLRIPRLPPLDLDPED